MEGNEFTHRAKILLLKSTPQEKGTNTGKDRARYDYIKGRISHALETIQKRGKILSFLI